MRLLIAAILAGAAMTANAEESVDRCAQPAELAKAIMSARQAGVPLVDVLKIEPGADFAELAKMLAIAAYDKPGFSTEQNRKRAIVDFQNDVYLECIKQR